MRANFQEEAFKCQFTGCRKFFETPVILTCCGETICQKHLNNLRVNDHSEKMLIIKCCFCNEVLSVPKAGFPLNKLMDKVLNLYSGKNSIANKVKTSLNELEEKLKRYKSLKNDPQGCIQLYFDDVKIRVNKKRERDKQFIDDYYDTILKEINNYEIECKSNKKIDNNDRNYFSNEGAFNSMFHSQSDLMFKVKKPDFYKYEKMFGQWSEQINQPNIDETKLNKLKHDINHLKDKLDKKIKKTESSLLNNLTYEFKSGNIEINSYDLLGCLEINSRNHDKKYELISSSMINL